jgi:hypothetical protein
MHLAHRYKEKMIRVSIRESGKKPAAMLGLAYLKIKTSLPL